MGFALGLLDSQCVTFIWIWRSKLKIVKIPQRFFGYLVCGVVCNKRFFGYLVWAVVCNKRTRKKDKIAKNLDGNLYIGFPSICTEHFCWDEGIFVETQGNSSWVIEIFHDVRFFYLTSSRLSLNTLVWSKTFIKVPYNCNRNTKSKRNKEDRSACQTALMNF